MSLGYVKGKYWVSDDRYAAYSCRESYKALTRATVQAGFCTDVSFGYTSQRYAAEILTIETFGQSQQPYIVRHNNAYDENPMAALTRAIRESGRATLLVAVCCLEIESELLLESARTARAAEDKLETALDGLRATLDKIPVAFTQGDRVLSVATVGDLRGKPVPRNPMLDRMTKYADEDDDL